MRLLYSLVKPYNCLNKSHWGTDKRTGGNTVGQDTATPRRILRRHEAAIYLGLSVGHLRNMAGRNEGPRTVRLGARAIGYEIAALDYWLEERRAPPPTAQTVNPQRGEID